MTLPITPLFWFAAIAPLTLVLVLLIGLRWKASSAAAAGYLLAVGIAIGLFRTGLDTVALQSVKGVWDALFIAYVILPALILYEICDEAGAFDTIRRGIEAITPNTLLHVLAFGWVFPSFLQSITGFGAPIAVAAPLLLAIGVRPVWAVALPIIGHAWAKTFGTLGVAWEALTRVTDVDQPATAIIATALMLAMAALLAGIVITWLFGRWQALREAWPALLLISAIMGFGQLAVAPFAPNLANVVPTAVALIVIVALARTVYARPSQITQSPLMADDAASTALPAEAEAEAPRRPMPLWLAFAPYLLLTVLIMAVELIPAIGDPLGALRFGLPFGGAQTGYGVITPPTDAYSGFAPLAHPGTLLLVVSVVAFVVFRIRRDIPFGRIDDIAVDAIKTSIPTIMALLAFVAMALVLQGSGMILELAAGLGQVATPPVYALLAPLIGALGGFLTGSNLSANILFGPLQAEAAEALRLAPEIILAAQTAGAAIGSSITISAVLLGLGAVGAAAHAGVAIRKMMPFVVIALAAIAAMTLAGTWMFPTSTANGG